MKVQFSVVAAIVTGIMIRSSSANESRAHLCSQIAAQLVGLVLASWIADRIEGWWFGRSRPVEMTVTEFVGGKPVKVREWRNGRWIDVQIQETQ